MAPPPRRNFEEEEESSSEEETSSEEDSTTTPAIKPRAKFEDEEDDSDVVDDWEAEDSEAEREKAKKEEEAKKKAAAAAAASKKSKKQRIEEHVAKSAALRKELDEMSSDEEEDEATKRRRLKEEQQQAGIQQAADLFGAVDIKKANKTAPKTLVNVDPSDPTKLADLSELPLFAPTTRTGFENMRVALAPLIGNNAKQSHYSMFMTEFVKQICKDMNSSDIKKAASALTTLSNEKLKDEKAAEKGGKKSKAAKTKTSLVAGRNVANRADVEDYGDELADDDFM